MSMLSGQADKLRKEAQNMRDFGRYEMEQMLLDAADTITELRGALQVASVDYRHLAAENAKLRELVRIAIEYCDSGTCDGCPIQRESGSCPYSDMARELGVEVDA